jgi:hypothetical protein
VFTQRQAKLDQSADTGILPLLESASNIAGHHARAALIGDSDLRHGHERTALRFARIGTVQTRNGRGHSRTSVHMPQWQCRDTWAGGGLEPAHPCARGCTRGTSQEYSKDTAGCGQGKVKGPLRGPLGLSAAPRPAS